MVQVCSIIVSKKYIRILIVILLLFLACGSIFAQQKKASTAITFAWLLGFGSGHFYIGNDLGGTIFCVGELAALGIAGIYSILLLIFLHLLNNYRVFYISIAESSLMRLIDLNYFSFRLLV